MLRSSLDGTLARTVCAAHHAPRTAFAHARYVPAGHDGIGRLELTRPEKLNATDDDSVRDLDRAATTRRDATRARAPSS